MKNHLKLSLEKAVETYNNGDQKTKDLLISLYGKSHFLTNVKDRVIDYETACQEINFKPLTADDFDFLPEEDRNRYYARHQLTIGIRALVEDYEPDWDSSDLKYFNYFYKEEAGFRSVVHGRYYGSGVGSDLYFPNKDLAEHAAKIFKQQYIDYLF